MLGHGTTALRKDMASLIGPESWLIFNLLDISGSQDWLMNPASTWPLSKEFQKLKDFACHLVVINDLAERGIHLATEFINAVDKEDQRAALFQVVENFRSRVKDVNKSSLKLV